MVDSRDRAEVCVDNIPPLSGHSTNDTAISGPKTVTGLT